MTAQMVGIGFTFPVAFILFMWFFFFHQGIALWRCLEHSSMWKSWRCGCFRAKWLELSSLSHPQCIQAKHLSVFVSSGLSHTTDQDGHRRGTLSKALIPSFVDVSVISIPILASVSISTKRCGKLITYLCYTLLMDAVIHASETSVH